jgi:hypothetical protein
LQSKAEQSWLTRHAEALEIKLQNSDEDEIGPSSSKKSGLVEVQKLQQVSKCFLAAKSEVGDLFHGCELLRFYMILDLLHGM